MSEELLKSFGKNDMGDEIVKRWQQRFRPEAWLASPDNAQYLEGYEDFLTGKKKVATIDRSDEGNNVITYNPNCPIGFNPFAQEWVGYSTPHREKGDIQPTVYSTKHWRNGRGTHWSGDQWLPGSDDGPGHSAYDVDPLYRAPDPGPELPGGDRGGTAHCRISEGYG